MWNWDQNNPWKCSDKHPCKENHCHDNDSCCDNQCDGDYDSGLDSVLLHNVIKALFVLKREIEKCEILLCNPKFGLKEIKHEVRNIERAIFSPTFGLEEIKSEISHIATIVEGIQDQINNPAEIPITLLNDIKSEVSAIESAVLSPTFGLEEIKSEISLILANQGVSNFLTTGPFLVECEGQNLVLKALNNSAVTQAITFVIRGFGATPTLLTEGLGPIAPCSVEDVVLDIATTDLTPGNLEVRALRTSIDVLPYVANTTCSGRKITEFKAADFLPLTTFCIHVI